MRRTGSRTSRPRSRWPRRRWTLLGRSRRSVTRPATAGSWSAGRTQRRSPPSGPAVVGARRRRPVRHLRRRGTPRRRPRPPRRCRCRRRSSSPARSSTSRRSSVSATALRSTATASSSAATSTASRRSLPPGQVLLYRVIVVVTFTTANDTDCAAGCTYVTSTLIDPSTDPTFNTNDATVPPAGGGGRLRHAQRSQPRGDSTIIDVLGNDSGTFSTYPVVISRSAQPRGRSAASSTGIVTYTATNGASGTDYFTYYLRDVTGRTSTAATVAMTHQPARICRRRDDRPRASRHRQPQDERRRDLPDVRDHAASRSPARPSNGAIVLGTCGSITYTPTGILDGDRLLPVHDHRHVSLESRTRSPRRSRSTHRRRRSTTRRRRTRRWPCRSPSRPTTPCPAGSATTSIVTTSSNGTATVSGTNITFTPNANYSGTTSFTYRLTDTYTNTSGNATVTVTVRPTAAALPASGTGAGKTVSSTVDQLRQGGLHRHATSAATSAAGKHGHCQRRDADLQPQGRLHGHGHRDLHGDRHVRTDRLRRPGR